MASETFIPSDARTVGLFSTLVLLSVMIMFNSAPGKGVEKSADEMWPKPDKATAVLAAVLVGVVVVVGGVVTGVVVVVAVVEVVEVVEVVVPLTRTGLVGLNETGRDSPA